MPTKTIDPSGLPSLGLEEKLGNGCCKLERPSSLGIQGILTAQQHEVAKRKLLW